MSELGILPGGPALTSAGAGAKGASTERVAGGRQEARGVGKRRPEPVAGSAEFSSALAGILGEGPKLPPPDRVTAPKPAAGGQGTGAVAEGGAPGGEQGMLIRVTGEMPLSGAEREASAGAVQLALNAVEPAPKIEQWSPPSAGGKPGMEAASAAGAAGIGPLPEMLEAREVVAAQGVGAAQEVPVGEAALEAPDFAEAIEVLEIERGPELVEGRLADELEGLSGKLRLANGRAGSAGTSARGGTPPDPSAAPPRATASAAASQVPGSMAAAAAEGATLEDGRFVDSAPASTIRASTTSASTTAVSTSAASTTAASTTAASTTAASASVASASVPNASVPSPMASSPPESSAAPGGASLAAAGADPGRGEGEGEREQRGGRADGGTGEHAADAVVGGADGAGTARGGGASGASGVGASATGEVRGGDFAGRVARVLEIQDGIAAQPVTRVMLRLDDDAGGGQVRVGVRGAAVAAEITVADPMAAGRLQMRVDELARALSQQGLEPGALQVESVRRSQVGEALGGVGATHAELEALGLGRVLERGSAMTGRDEDRTRDPERGARDLDQERSRREQKREDEQ